jgi:hypothetical protein
MTRLAAVSGCAEGVWGCCEIREERGLWDRYILKEGIIWIALHISEFAVGNRRENAAMGGAKTADRWNCHGGPDRRHRDHRRL